MHKSHRVFWKFYPLVFGCGSFKPNFLLVVLIPVCVREDEAFINVSV